MLDSIYAWHVCEWESVCNGKNIRIHESFPTVRAKNTYFSIIVTRFVRKWKITRFSSFNCKFTALTSGRISSAFNVAYFACTMFHPLHVYSYPNGYESITSFNIPYLIWNFPLHICLRVRFACLNYFHLNYDQNMNTLYSLCGVR